MRIHLSVEDLESFREGNVTVGEKEKIKIHLDGCRKCREKYDILVDLENYLKKEDYLDSEFTKRVVYSLSKNKHVDKRNYGIKKRGILKPVLSGVLICVFVGSAFYFGSKYDTFKRNSAADPDNLNIVRVTEAPTAAPVKGTPENSPEAVEKKIRELGNKVLTAFKNKDMKLLSSIVHPDKGVRFSPYTYVEVEKDVVITAEEMIAKLDDNKVHTWGVYDGIGDPIELTFADYVAEFVYDKDFLNADEVIYDQYVSRGNTVNNVFEVYAGSHVLEYYFKGTAEYDGMDWESLKLVFEEKDGNWYLIGVVHDQWTI